MSESAACQKSLLVFARSSHAAPIHSLPNCTRYVQLQMPQRCSMSKKPSRPSVLSQELAFLAVSNTIQCRPGRRRCHANSIFRLTSCLRQRSSLLSSLALVARVCEMQSCKRSTTVSGASSECICAFAADIARGLSPTSCCVVLYVWRPFCGAHPPLDCMEGNAVHILHATC